MRFTQPFLKLPIRFDAAALEAEVRGLPASAWVPHPTGFPGNEAVRLVTVGGRPSDDFERITPSVFLSATRLSIASFRALDRALDR